MSTELTNRHDILILFEVTNGNPNGDPDSGNMPRVDPASSLGLVSDVCLKRKVRNYVQMFAPSRNGKGFNILIQQGTVINREIRAAAENAASPESEAEKKKSHAERTKDWLCREFFDIRTFGAVLATGEKDSIMKGSAYGQVRGPVQFTFGRSFHPITPLEVTITRCTVTKEEDVAKERTMGQKYIVPYALYSARCYVSPAFAEQTGFDQADFHLLIEALSHLFDHDRSAARGDMVVRGVFDFERVGTQAEGNDEQNRREARLGCAHAHQLFETVKVDLKDKSNQPVSFADYDVTVTFEEKKFPGVKLHTHIDPELRAPKLE
jgi:CRISPR-associated protein Csd2